MRDNHDLMFATDGHKALEIANDYQPDLILLDIMMPEIDGFEVCKHLKANGSSRDIPVIFITAMDDYRNKKEGFRLGAVDYVTKPFQTSEIKARINIHLTIRRTQVELKQTNDHLQVVHEELERLNTELEKRVQKRTRDLEFANKTIQGSEAQFRGYFELGLIGMARISLGKRWVHINDHLCKILGYSHDELRDMTWVELTHPDDIEKEIILFDRALQNKIDSYHLQKRFLRKDRRAIYVDVSMQCVVGSNGQADHFVTMVQDITERIKSEHDRLLLASVIEQAHETVVITDREGTIQFVNPAFERITGYSKSEAIGNNPNLLNSGTHSGDFYKQLWETINSGEVWKGHFINRHANGSLFEEDATILPVKNSKGKITNFAAIKRDVTQEKELEQRLQQAQKMESIGTLAGGIAHDFNNILSAIIGYGEMIELFDDSADDDTKENVGELLKAAYRANSLVQQILAFSRRGEREIQPVQIAPILKEALQFLRASVPSTIEIKPNIVSFPETIMADATQIHQVIMNICTNAVQAMGDRGGTLDISLSVEYLGDKATSRVEELPSGAYAKLSISDTGDGIPENILSRVFEPYFTTKKIGKGTGLGLAVTHGIIEQHQGAITVESQPGKGTTFHVMLPLTVEHERTRGTSSISIKTGKGCILLVDDEESLVHMGGKALSLLGYEVETETDSIIAFERFLNNPDRYDVIISDQTMPGFTGTELAKKIKRIRPEIPIVLCTGFSESISQEELTEIGIESLLRKPFSLHQLSDAMHKFRR